MGNQKELCYEILKIGKPGGRCRKINSRKEFFLYSIAFSLTINQYLCSNFKDPSFD